MSNLKRMRNLQGLILGDYKEPKFIPTNQTLATERARRFASQKLLSGWTPGDVIEYLVNFHYYAPEKARAIVVPLYNRLTTPLKELRKEFS